MTRGMLNLTRRGGMDTAVPLEPGEVYDVEVELEATAWQWRRGHLLRLALAGADWPNTAAPPRARHAVGPRRASAAAGVRPRPGRRRRRTSSPATRRRRRADHGVVWRVERDVLAPHDGLRRRPRLGVRRALRVGGRALRGRVQVSTRTFAQVAAADVSFTLRFPTTAPGSRRR